MAKDRKKISNIGMTGFKKNTKKIGLLKLRKNNKNNKNRLISIFLSAILVRIGMYLLYFMIMVMFGEYQEGIGVEDYLGAWVRWDASHYVNLAKMTYSGYVEEGQHLFLVFLPMYPWLMRLLNYVTHSYELAGLLISTLSYAIGCVYFDLTIREHYDEEVSNFALVGISVFPFSFFLGGIVTESLFFALAAAFLYYLETNRYFTVGLLGFAACLTKLQGGFLAFVVLVYLLHENDWIDIIKSKDFKGFLKKIIIPGLKCVPMLLGIVAYLWLNYYVEGDPFRFMYYQENHWTHTVGPIWGTLKYCIENFIGNKYSSIGYVLWLPQVALIWIGLIAIVYSIKERMCPHYVTYLVIFYLVTFSSTWLVSGGRYCVSILPMFEVEGILLKKHRMLRIPVLGISLSIMILYTMAYYKWMPIM